MKADLECARPALGRLGQRVQHGHHPQQRRLLMPDLERAALATSSASTPSTYMETTRGQGGWTDLWSDWKSACSALRLDEGLAPNMPGVMSAAIVCATNEDAYRTRSANVALPARPFVHLSVSARERGGGRGTGAPGEGGRVRVHVLERGEDGRDAVVELMREQSLDVAHVEGPFRVDQHDLNREGQRRKRDE